MAYWISEFCSDFFRRWKEGDEDSPLVSACQWFHGEHLDLFTKNVQRVGKSANCAKAYASVCEQLFEDGKMNTGRVLSLLTFSVLLNEAMPDMRMVHLLAQQIESRRACWSHLEHQFTQRKWATCILL